MKKLLLLSFSLMSLLFANNHVAQCIVDTTLAPGTYTSSLPNGCVNSPYDESAQFAFPADTITFGFTVTIDSIAFTGFLNLPAGITATCDQPTCVWVANPPSPTRMCVSFSGTPSASYADSIEILTTLWYETFAGPASINDTMRIALTIGAETTGSMNANACGIYTAPSGATHTVGGTVMDTIPNMAGCDSIITISLTIDSLSVASYSYTATNLDVDFTDGSSAGAGATYLWDFGDGNTSTTQNPSHSYAAAGTYLSCLTISNSCGADSSCVSITVTDAATGLSNNWIDYIAVYPIPAQDLLTIDGLKANENAQLRILNNLGQIVHQGQTNGKSQMMIQVSDMAPGTYQLSINTESQVSSRSIVIIK